MRKLQERVVTDVTILLTPVGAVKTGKHGRLPDKMHVASNSLTGSKIFCCCWGGSVE